MTADDAARQPEVIRRREVRHTSARSLLMTVLGEFVLPYEAVRTSGQPAEALTAFLESTYDAAARLARWDREALER